MNMMPFLSPRGERHCCLYNSNSRRKKDLSKGKQHTIQEIARQTKANDIPLSSIAQCTSLNKTEVEKSLIGTSQQMSFAQKIPEDISLYESVPE